MNSDSNKVPGILRRMIDGIMKPGLLVSVSYWYHLVIFLRSPSLAFRDFSSFRHRAFSRLWAVLGGLMSKELHGDTADRLKSASGMILDVGPGTGEIINRLNSDLITKAYGVEPAVDMHPALLKNIQECGLDGKYEILACGAEPQSLIPELERRGLLKSQSRETEGIFDAILCIRVLCGIPKQQETINELYRLLKPDGRLIFYEHIANPWPGRGASIVGYILQKFWLAAGWNLMMGGCELNRDTVSALKKAPAGHGMWKKTDIVYWDTWNAVPFVVGEMVKG
ncbi:hypothetical protein GQ53DRAFT_815054 [Thozetella sp. PMI_491]|nr:hypothetical protein GQ53DRAFT_815054 [Thozetella sp. PMI_491]